MKFFKTVAVMLAVSFSLMVPSFAWDSDSFVGHDFYFYEPVINSSSRAPSLMADSDISSVSGEDFLSRLSVSGQYVSPIMRVHKDSYTVAGVTVPSYTGPLNGDWYPVSFWDSTSIQKVFGAYVPYDFTSFYDSVVGWYAPAVSYDSDPVPDGFASSSLVYDFDLSSFSSFSSFELDGLSTVYSYLYDGTFVSPNFSSSLALYVNGSLVHTFYPNSNNTYDFSFFVYNSSVPVTSIQFKLTWSLSSYQSLSLSLSGSVYCLFPWEIGSVPTSFTILSDDDILSGQAGSTQDDVNEIEGLESQWGNSMTENFNALSLDTFTYPDGLTSGFSLISGIFQDLWNTMGSYSILYVLPLTLAVVLLLIGRISKFAGQGRDSSKED